MPAMAKLRWILKVYVLGAPWWLLVILVCIFDRRPHAFGQGWNDEWMDSYVPGRDVWNTPDWPDDDDNGEPIDVILLVGASLCLGACLHNRGCGNPIRGPPAFKLPKLTDEPAILANQAGTPQ